MLLYQSPCVYTAVSNPPYPMVSLSAVPVVSHVCFLCSYQPDSPLHFYLPSSPSSHISASVILVILYICHVSSVAVSIVPHLCLCHLHCYAYLLPHSLRVFPPIVSRFITPPPFLYLPLHPYPPLSLSYVSLYIFLRPLSLPPPFSPVFSNQGYQGGCIYICHQFRDASTPISIYCTKNRYIHCPTSLLMPVPRLLLRLIHLPVYRSPLSLLHSSPSPRSSSACLHLQPCLPSPLSRMYTVTLL